MSGVTLQDAKTWLGLEDTLDDARLTIVLQGVLALVDQFCRTPLIAKTLKQKFVSNQSEWYLNSCPVQSVTSILDPAGNSITSSQYILAAELGIIEPYSHFPTAVRSDGSVDRWEVTYVAGHFATENDVSADVALPILDMVSDYFHKAGPDIQSQRVGPENTVAFIPNPSSALVLPQRVQMILSPYRRRLF